MSPTATEAPVVEQTPAGGIEAPVEGQSPAGGSQPQQAPPSSLGFRLRKLLQPLTPWQLPPDWRRTADMTDEELAEEARGQHQLLRAVGIHDAAVLHPFLMNVQYLRFCQSQGKIPFRPYFTLYGLVLMFALGGAAIVAVNLTRVAATSYSAWMGWEVGAVVGLVGGAVMGFFGGYTTAALQQFSVAYGPAWFYEPRYVPCGTCNRTGYVDDEEDEDEDRDQNEDGIGQDVLPRKEPAKVECWACGGDGDVELLEAVEMGFEYVLRLTTLDNPDILYTGSGAAAGIQKGGLFLKAPKDFHIADLDDTNVLNRWESGHGRFVGENERETRNAYTEAEEAGKLNPWRTSSNIGQLLKEWSGLLLLVITIAGSIFYMSFEGGRQPPDKETAAVEAPYVVPGPETPPTP